MEKIELVLIPAKSDILSSSEDEPLSSLSSKISIRTVREKKENYDNEPCYTYDSRICTYYVPMSDSQLLISPYAGYPFVKDPGIEEALFDSQQAKVFSDDGQDLYLHLCSEMNLCPVRLFHKNLLNSEISLCYYGVKSEQMYAMAKALKYNRFVTCFNLTDNYLNVDACYHLGEMLETNVTLEELNLTGCRLDPENLFRLINSLSVKNRSLISINLASNRICDEGGLYIAKILCDGAVIKHLNISNNNLGQFTALAFANALKWRNPLTKLDISWNNFSDSESTTAMINILSINQMLEELYLCFNSMEGDKVAYALCSILSLPELKILDLSHNRFRDSAISIITAGLTNIRKMETFSLSYNPITPNEAYNVLHKMLKPRIKLKQLLMDGVAVDKYFPVLLNKVTSLNFRKNFVVTHGDVIQNWSIEGPDSRVLLLKRAHYLATRSKKHKIDIGLYFLRLFEVYNLEISTKTMASLMAHDKVPLSESFIEELSIVFPGTVTRNKCNINMVSLTDFIKRLWPDKKILPPLPPVDSQSRNTLPVKRQKKYKKTVKKLRKK